MRKLLIILCLAMLGLAGCGDDGGGDVDVPARDAKEDASGDADADADAGSGDEADPQFTGKGGKNFCEYLKELDENEEDLDLGSGEDTPENRKKAKDALEIFDELEDKAPAEIKADVVLVIKQIRPIFVAFSEGKDAATAAGAEPTEAEQKEFEAAGARVEAYSENVCGIKDDEAPTDDGGDSGSSGDEQAPAEEDLPADE